MPETEAGAWEPDRDKVAAADRRSIARDIAAIVAGDRTGDDTAADDAKHKYGK
ncbi:hypothetical protein [Nocardiopsis sp. LOL_012]|uniref:hypothetical protein n=1 Tax=Nocardiopsis sp. LOL_012 TaxID=3345409 RepID=UPI003A83FD6E